MITQIEVFIGLTILGCAIMFGYAWAVHDMKNNKEKFQRFFKEAEK